MRVTCGRVLRAGMAAVLLACLSCRVSLAADVPLQEPATNSPWIAAATKYRIDVAVLYALALRESALRSADGAVRAWPWTLRSSQTGALYFDSYEAALAKLTSLIASDVRNIDVGLMQVNWRWNGHRLPDPKRLLLPAENIDVAAQILREHLDALDGDLRGAIARYHSPRDEVGLPYAAAVLAIRDYLRSDRGIQRALQQ